MKGIDSMSNVSSGYFKVLSIDAWAGDNEFSWEWNEWHYIDSIRLVDINDNDEIKMALVEHGFIGYTGTVVCNRIH